VGKSKNGSREVESLRGEVRRLRKLLKNAEKHHRLIEESEPLEPEILVPEINTKASCPECHTGTIQLILSLDKKDIFTCTNCEFRKVVNK